MTTLAAGVPGILAPASGDPAPDDDPEELLGGADPEELPKGAGPEELLGGDDPEELPKGADPEEPLR